MNPRRTSSATSRRPSRRSRATTRTSSKRKRKSRTARASSRKRSTERRPSRLTSSSASASGFLGLGSNLGDSPSLLRDALARIRAAPGARVVAVSSFYRTDPVGHADQPDFVNAVAKIAWRGTPGELLRLVRKIEDSLGRVRRFRDGPREIDVDILDFGGLVRRRPDPVLPHPRMHERRFVLAPLAEIAPRWRHPLTHETARQMMARLPERPGVERLPG